jgi:hypothetical protein
MVGAGWWASVAHLPALHDQRSVDLVTVVDSNPGRVAAAAGSFDIPHQHQTIDAPPESEQLDGIVVATPHSTDFPIVSAALRAGVSVLVDKPLATTADDAWQLVELQRQSGAQLVVGATYQYALSADQVREAVQGMIGDLVSVNAEFSSHAYSIFTTTDPSAANLDVPGLPHGTTYSDPALSGGRLALPGGWHCGSLPEPLSRPPDHSRGPVNGFVDLLLGIGGNRTPADVAAVSGAIIDAAYVSASSGQPVRVQRGPLHSVLGRKQQS